MNLLSCLWIILSALCLGVGVSKFERPPVKVKQVYLVRYTFVSKDDLPGDGVIEITTTNPTRDYAQLERWMDDIKNIGGFKSVIITNTIQL